MEPCSNADFTFQVSFDMKDHTVYVRKRPFLQTFLERVAEMFEVVIFTASQSIYAEQVLDILDPEKKYIARRLFRESCIFSDGSYTKDLTAVGVDLSKIAIIDNSPQVAVSLSPSFSFLCVLYHFKLLDVLSLSLKNLEKSWVFYFYYFYYISIFKSR